MNVLIRIISVLFFTSSFAQIEFPVKIQDFSEDFEGRIELNDQDTIIITQYDEYVPPYVIRIIDKKTNSEALRTYTSDFPDYLLNESNEAVPNIQELPYGSQSILIYEDFNFDGIEDFALMNGYNSCYGGPSFDVYLVDKNKKIDYSESFSDLSNNYCGMFQTDPDTKTIHTMTKSGCCWHQFSEFTVINNEPKPIKITEESYLLGTSFYDVSEFTYENGKETLLKKLFFPVEDLSDQILFSFELEKNKKRVILYKSDENLNYALIREDEEVEFYYPLLNKETFNIDYSSNDFEFDSKKNTLHFQNADAEYEIYETGNTVGIKVQTKGKTYHLKGKEGSKIASLSEILSKNLKNIQTK